MKKWILILALAVALIAAVVIVSQMKPDIDTTQNGIETTESTGTTESTEVSIPIESTLTYEEYQAMSGTERQAHFMSFSSEAAFNAWLAAAKEDYDARQSTRETINGDGPIDIGGLIGGNND